MTYYEAEVDLRRLADLPNLGAEQRRTIADATAALDAAGYAGTDERIAIDQAGYVVETTATTVFADGARFRTHTVLSHFGCVGRVVMPADPTTSASEPAPDCVAPTTTTLPTVQRSTSVPPPSTSSSTSSTTTLGSPGG